MMMLFETKDKSTIAYLDRTVRNKYTHHNMQTELLNIMSRHVLLSKLETIRFFLITLTSPISNSFPFPFVQ